MKTFLLRMEQATFSKLRQWARKERRSINAQILVILEEALARWEKALAEQTENKSVLAGESEEQ